MPLERFTTKAVLANHRSNSAARTPSRSTLSSKVFLPKIDPGFTFGKSAKIFTMGSCFARNIERTLHAVGVDTPSFDVIEGIGARFGNVLGDEPLIGIFNKYTPHSLANEIAWIAEGASVDKGVLRVDDELGWASQHHWRTTAPHKQVRQITTALGEHTKTVFEADVIFITLGLVECWFDRTTNTGLNEKPPGRFALDPRFECHTLSYSECKAEIFRLLNILTTHNPTGRIIITVSPVTLSTTMGTQDVRVRNSYSKSVLRAVAEECVFKFLNVEYFPSYEIAALNERETVYTEDEIHIRQDFVDTIIYLFLSNYASDDLLLTSAMATSAFSAALTLPEPKIAGPYYEQYRDTILIQGDIQQLVLLYRVSELLGDSKTRNVAGERLTPLLGHGNGRIFGA